MPSTRLLIVEDEHNLGSTLSEQLIQNQYHVTWAKSCEEAKDYYFGQSFDLVLLDVGLPDGSGFDLAKEFRQSAPATAIVFLTAFATPEDRIRGLELGAEDYISKPFHLKELLLRVDNALKRARALKLDSAPEEWISIGKARFHLSRFKVESPLESKDLSHKECLLIRLLLEKRGEVVSRDEILQKVWPEDEYPSPRTIDNFISRIRKWVEAKPETPSEIVSVRGVGYKLKD